MISVHEVKRLCGKQRKQRVRKQPEHLASPDQIAIIFAKTLLHVRSRSSFDNVTTVIVDEMGEAVELSDPPHRSYALMTNIEPERLIGALQNFERFRKENSTSCCLADHSGTASPSFARSTPNYHA